MFANIIGQEKLKRYFTRIVDSGQIPHSFLLYGPEGTGKTAAAFEIARILTCHDSHESPCGTCVSCVKFRTMEHPDVLLYFPVPGSIKPEEIQSMRVDRASHPYQRTESAKKGSLHIEIVREIKHRLRLQSYQGHGRVIILLECEFMTLDTANALLKLLEEPPRDVTFILTTAVLDDILPTIRSRCQVLYLSYLSASCIARALQDRENIPRERADDFARLSGGSYTRALDFLRDDFASKKAVCDKILECCCSQSVGDMISLSEELTTAKNFSQTDVTSILELLVGILKYNYETSVDHHDDAPAGETLLNIPPCCAPDDSSTYASAIGEIEKSVDLLHKNVYLNTILLNLFLKIGKVFKNRYVYSH